MKRTGQTIKHTMEMKQFIMAFAATAMALTGCTSSKKPESQTSQTSKSLVLYYSQTGTTKTVAEELQKDLGADIEQIEVELPYDGTYEETIGRCQKEMETGELPALKPLKADISRYDTIYLGYPVWFGTCASPVTALVGQQKFEGKTVIPFCTFGSGGLNATVADLRKALPEADVKDGYGVRTVRISRMPKELDYFLKKNGYVEGEVAPLPDFSDQVPVTDDGRTLFQAACGDYKFPLGTPVTVGQRSVEEGTEYKFTVESKDRNGNDATATVYVMDYKEEGGKPEFTSVER